MKNNWPGILLMIVFFLAITVWPGPKHWYIGAAAFGIFMVWLGLKTWR